MVRFIILEGETENYNSKVIYIPIWLDLLSAIRRADGITNRIYIPIWLDLLSAGTLTSYTGNAGFTFQYG